MWRILYRGHGCRLVQITRIAAGTARSVPNLCQSIRARGVAVPATAAALWCVQSAARQVFRMRKSYDDSTAGAGRAQAQLRRDAA